MVYIFCRLFVLRSNCFSRDTCTASVEYVDDKNTPKNTLSGPHPPSADPRMCKGLITVSHSKFISTKVVKKLPKPYNIFISESMLNLKL